jgi:hypothetical protein
VDDHVSSYNVKKFQFEPYLGSDVSALFNKVPLWERYCPNIERPTPLDWDNIAIRPQESVNYKLHNETDPSSGVGKLYLEYMNRFAVGRVAWDWRFINKEASQKKRLLVIYDNVYDGKRWELIVSEYVFRNCEQAVWRSLSSLIYL